MIFNKIADVRRSKGVSQVQLAARIGVTGGRISQIESSPWWNTCEHIGAIARALGVPPSILLTGSPIPSEGLENAVRAVLKTPQSNGCIVLTQDEIAMLERSI